MSDGPTHLDARLATFERELRDLLNRHDIDTVCSTPDDVLAMYLVGCVRAYRGSVVMVRQRIGKDAPAKPAPTITDHAYLSAGDVAGASGDRAYTGCYSCNRPRSEHTR